VATQTVTVLFTDLVGSTELSSRLGPEATEALRQTHFGLLRGAIQSAGGTEVKNLGDGLMVAFTSLSRALACAVSMQQAIDRHNQRAADAPLAVRIGIATGEATEEDGDYFGDPVVEAARLCAAAQGGQILATEVVKLMAGRHATQEFVSVGELELKGLPDPVATVEVAWEPAAAVEDGQQAPLPARLVGASAESVFAFFGRADEMAKLVDAQKVSATERCLRVCLVSGEPGIGKTTLVAQAARRAHANGANVVYGSCEEGLAVPYQPWIRALSQLVEHADESFLREFVAERGPAVARLIPDLARRLAIAVPAAGNDADSERFLILDGVAHLLARASTAAPLVVVLDDLHWVDAASLQMLRHLATSAVPMAVQVVGTFRESDLSRSHPLVGVLADLRRESSVERIDLTGLADVEILDLLGAAAGHEMADDGVALAHALRRETSGNPFFLVEVLRHLAESGAFGQDESGRWVLTDDLETIGLPSSVREVVGHRVARLGDVTARVLSTASVIGREFDLDLLMELVDLDEDALFDLLDGAITAGLLAELPQQVGRYRFVHALIQHTLYQDLNGSRRQRAHQRIAEAIEARSTDGAVPVAELAHHWLSATRPSDATKAIYYTRAAGDAALAAFAPMDAVGWYAQALELLDRQPAGDDRLRCELLVALGTAQSRAGDDAYRNPLREAGTIALRLDDRELLVLVALARDPGFEIMTEPDPARIAVIEAALAAVGAADSPERARLLAGLAEEMDPRDADRRSATGIEAIEVAHRVGDDATLLAVLSLTLHPIDTPDILELRRRESRIAHDLAERANDWSALYVALTNLCHVSIVDGGDVDEFDTRLAEMERVVERTALPLHRCTFLAFRSWRQLLAGRPSEAEADSNEMLEVSTRSGMAAPAAWFGAQLLERATQSGGLAEIVDVVAEVAREQETIPAWRLALMAMYLELQRLDDAARLFDIGAQHRFDDLPFDITWTQGATHYGECAIALGDLDAVQLLYEKFVPYANQVSFMSVVGNGAVARALGRMATALGRYDAAEEHLHHALAIHERMAAPYWIARTCIDLAELSLARRADDTEAARTHLERAQTLIDNSGSGGLQWRVDQLAARLA
jgi:class 3 adenylate cyclase/tetratricopeptide (TPR) repeat protein